MDFKNNIFTTKVLSYKGKINRNEFIILLILTQLALYLVTTITNYLRYNTSFHDISYTTAYIIGFIIMTLFLYINSCHFIKRLRDTGNNGWLYIFIIVPVINIILFLFLLLKSSSINK